MNVSYKMMGVVLCGAMLLASGCGAKAETTASSAVESESVSVVALEAASSEAVSEAVPESKAVSEAVSEASSSVSEAASEKPAESKAESKEESKAETAAKSKPAKQETAASSKEEKTEPVESKPVTETAPAETALKYVGKDVSKLYATIGKPNSSEYASSCIGDGEDGLLYYNGFTVTTYRENGKETVQDAY